MQFIDLNKQYQRIKSTIDERIQTVINHGRFILGPEVKELEDALADYVGCKHVITCANGTDAILIALMALEIKPGDEVITTPFTFFATIEMITMLGAIPIFVDIDPQTFNINPELIAAKITEKTRAIMPVSLYGQCANMKKINEIANQHQIPVIEDAAQSFGATHHGKKSCNLTTIACTSFYPAKALGCYGDGGACFTNDDELANAMRKLRNHGQEKTYYHTMIGINSRLDTIQAAVLLEKLKIFPEELKLRNEIAKQYKECLEGLVSTPYISAENYSCYAQYTIRVEHRDALQAFLLDEQIPTAVHYPKAVYQQPAFQYGFIKEPCIEAEKAAHEVLSLPMHPYLEVKDIQMITNKIKAFTSVQEVA